MSSSLKELTKQLNKKYGKTIIKSGAAAEYIIKVPFREPKLDYIMDGGIPCNRFVEFLGDPQSGKSRDAAVAIESFQKYCFQCNTFNMLAKWKLDKDGFPELESSECICGKPKTCINVIIDIEGTIDIAFLRFFDIDVNGIYLARSETPSMTINLVEAYLRSPEVGLIIADGIGMQSSDAEIENAAEDIKMNSGMRVWNMASRKWLSALNSNVNSNGCTSPTTVIFINRKYQTVGQPYSTEVPQGGGGLAHLKGISLGRKRPSGGEVFLDMKKREGIVGFHRKLKIEKNKTGMPERKCEQFINLNPEDKTLGYLRADVNGEYIDLAIDLDIIVPKGSWFEFGEIKVQGREKLKELLTDAEDLKKAVNMLIYKKEVI